MGHDLAPGRHAVDEGEDQAGQRVGLVALLLLEQREAQLLLELLEIDAPVGVDRAVRVLDQLGLARPSCSSSSSPTISSTTSSIVTRPSVPPNSSTTSAIRLRVTRISSSRSSTRIEGGTTSTGASPARARSSRRRPRRGSRKVLDVDDAQHVVEIVAVHQQAEWFAACIALTTSRSGLLDLDALDVGARHHDVVDAELAEAQRVADEFALLLAERRGGPSSSASAISSSSASRRPLASPSLRQARSRTRRTSVSSRRGHGLLALGQLPHGTASARYGSATPRPASSSTSRASMRSASRRPRGRSPEGAARRGRAGGPGDRPPACLPPRLLARGLERHDDVAEQPGGRPARTPAAPPPRPGTRGRWSRCPCRGRLGSVPHPAVVGEQDAHLDSAGDRRLARQHRRDRAPAQVLGVGDGRAPGLGLDRHLDSGTTARCPSTRNGRLHRGRTVRFRPLLGRLAAPPFRRP